MRWGCVFICSHFVLIPTVSTDEMNHWAILGNCIAIVYPSCPQPVKILFTCLQSGGGLLHMLRKWHHFDIISPIICRQTCAGRRAFYPFLFLRLSQQQLHLLKQTTTSAHLPNPSFSSPPLLNTGQVTLNYSSARNEKSSWILNILSEVAANCVSLCGFLHFFYKEKKK